jgi:nucleotide-binding universal stress UspA family protein
MFEKILVPIDGSETSKAGLAEAVKLAQIHTSQLRICHVVNEFILDYTYSPAVCATNLIESLQETGKKIVREAEAYAHEHDVKADSVMLESIGGPAFELILAQARDWHADLIVMGTHGRRGLRRQALGSDAENVVRGAHVPVLLVRGGHSSKHRLPYGVSRIQPLRRLRQYGDIACGGDRAGSIDAGERDGSLPQARERCCCR